jgi:hypothetical protein
MDPQKLLSAFVLSSVTAVAALTGAAITLGPAVYAHAPLALYVCIPVGVAICLWFDPNC